MPARPSPWSGALALAALPALFAAGWYARASSHHMAAHFHTPAFASMTATAVYAQKKHSPQAVVKYKILQVG